MRRRRQTLGMAALVAVVGALASSSTASADVTVDVQHYPWAFPVSGCTEVVEASGTLTVVTQSTIDAAGGLHQRFIVIFQGAGYGVDTGEPYRISSESLVMNKPPANGATVNIMQGEFTVIPLGDGAKKVGTDTFRITINALGEVTSLKDEVNVVCH